MLWPSEMQASAASFSYRFTGRFGSPPNRVGLIVRYGGPGDFTAFEFQMGAAPDRRAWPVNHVRIVERRGDEEEVVASSSAAGGWFDDGNEHTIAARREGDRWTFTIDGVDQLTHDGPHWRPCGIVATRASVAVYELDTRGPG